MFRCFYIGLLTLAACGSNPASSGASSDGPFVGFTPVGAVYTASEVTLETTGAFQGTLGGVLLADGPLACSDDNTLVPAPSGTMVTLVPIVFSPNDTYVDVDINEGTYNCDANAPIALTGASRICVVARINYDVTPYDVAVSDSGTLNVEALSDQQATMSYDIVLDNGSKLSGRITAPRCSFFVMRAPASAASKSAIARNDFVEMWLARLKRSAQ